MAGHRTLGPSFACRRRRLDPGDRGRYPAAPPAEQVPLVVEVSDTTLAEDLGRKRTLYASGGIPEYWVADLSARVILKHWAAAGNAYTKSAVVPFGNDLASATLPGLTISTARLRDDTAELSAG